MFGGFAKVKSTFSHRRRVLGMVLGIGIAGLPMLEVSAQESSKEMEALEQMSLEDLLNEPLPGMMTTTVQGREPLSLTRISAAQIAITPARTIYDLLETYVPGAIFMHH